MAIYQILVQIKVTMQYILNPSLVCTDKARFHLIYYSKKFYSIGRKLYFLLKGQTIWVPTKSFFCSQNGMKLETF